MRRHIIFVVLLCCNMAVFSLEVNKEYATQIGISFLQQKANKNGATATQSLSQNVFTSMGQQVLSARETDIDISHLPMGTYILYANTTNGVKRTMFIKQ